MKEVSQSRRKTIMLLGCFALLVTLGACDSRVTQPILEPTATSSPTIVELPPQTVGLSTTQTLGPNSPTPAPSPTTMLTEASVTPSPNAVATASGATTPPGTDPDLKPGFPVVIGSSSGNLTMVVGNIDDTPSDEIILIIDQNGASQLLALGSDGKPVDGWPTGVGSYSDVALGEFTKASPGLEIVSYFTKQRADKRLEFGITIHTGSGGILPRWPITQPFTIPVGYMSPPDYLEAPMAVDLDGDDIDEVLATQTFLRADGSKIANWQINPRLVAVSDLDQDGKPEIITNYGGLKPLKAYRSDGLLLAGFEPTFPQGWSTLSTYPVIGDVDGDGVPEIVVIIYDLNEMNTGDPKHYALAIIAADGHVKQISNFTDEPTDRVALALGDLDCNGAAEIVLQTLTKLYVWNGNGTSLPGWPQDVGLMGKPFSPLIGDVNGDGQPDIVTLSRQLSDTRQAEILAYNKDGQPLPGFPKALDYGGGTIPAIADIDKDGRNEIILAGGQKNGPYTVWAFDLHGPGPYGAVQWGQHLGGPQHQSSWKPSSGCSR